jgi:dTDP-4-dehydrorhamnose reductase
MSQRTDPVILVAGATGQVGNALVEQLSGLGVVVGADRHVFDLTDFVQMRRAIAEIQPTVILNCAAYTAVDKAEAEPQLAMQINGVAPGVLAEEARRVGALLVHYSTDYVFDGTKDGPYVESDGPRPLNVYGQSKLAGERAIEQVGGAWVVLRTSWVYGLHGKNFLLTMMRLGAQRQELSVVADQFGAPTWSRTIAEMTTRMLRTAPTLHGEALPWWTERSGIYHMTASGATSWTEFAEAIFAHTSPNAAPKIVPITTAQYSAPARRPSNSRLSNEKLASVFGIAAPHWHAELQRCLQSVGDGSTLR